MSAFVLGIEGGGTRSRVVAMGLEERVLGRSQGRAALLDVSNAEAVAASVRHAAEEAAADAGLTLPAAAAWAGIAGAGRPGVRAALEGALESVGIADRLGVGTDVEAAGEDALGDGPGIVLLAGTGSIAWGRSRGGTEVRVGGWGQRLGDEGSGYWLGLEGLRAVVRAADGREDPTALTASLLDATGTDAPGDLIAWIQTAGKRRVAALAPIVTGLADTDAAARRIVVRAADELARMARVAAERLLVGGEENVPVVLAGGVLAAEGLLRQTVRDELISKGLVVSTEEADGARGAAKLALRLLRTTAF